MKSFSQFIKEEEGGVAGTNTASIPNPAETSQGSKRNRRRPLTRHYIEVNGKIKRTTKNLY